MSEGRSTVGNWARRIAVLVVGLFAFLVMWSMWFPLIAGMPDHAIVAVDDKQRIYYPPLPELLDARDSLLRLTTAGGARQAGYRPDPKARNQGYFTEKLDNLVRSLLVKIGILEPRPRWNLDGTWNW